MCSSDLVDVTLTVVNLINPAVTNISPSAGPLAGGQTVVITGSALDGAAITIRKFSKKKITLDVMEGYGSLSPAMKKVLQIAGRCRCNILTSGGTGSGKTTLLNAISQQIDHGERIVTIEDTAELSPAHPHVVALESQPPNLEGHGEVSVASMLRTALRLRPDRLVVGEVRGAEVLDMLAAMNTGHSGSLSTCHANSPLDAVRRLESLVLQHGRKWTSEGAREHIRAALDVCIHVARLRDGTRIVDSVVELPRSQHHLFVDRKSTRLNSSHT